MITSNTITFLWLISILALIILLVLSPFVYNRVRHYLSLRRVLGISIKEYFKMLRFHKEYSFDITVGKLTFSIRENGTFYGFKISSEYERHLYDVDPNQTKEIVELFKKDNQCDDDKIYKLLSEKSTRPIPTFFELHKILSAYSSEIGSTYLSSYLPYKLVFHVDLPNGINLAVYSGDANSSDIENERLTIRHIVINKVLIVGVVRNIVGNILASLD
jgi:hypothetical protein